MADIKKFLDQDGVAFLWQNIVKHFGEHFDPKNYELPILYLEGDITDMTKENAVDLTASYWGKTSS